MGLSRHPLTQSRQPAGQLALHGPGRATQHPRDLGLAEILVEPKYQDRSLPRTQRGQQRSELVPLIDLVAPLDLMMKVRNGALGLLHAQHLAPSGAAPPRQPRACHDRTRSGLQRSSIPDAIPGEVDLDQLVLEEVLGQTVVAGEEIGETQQRV